MKREIHYLILFLIEFEIFCLIQETKQPQTAVEAIINKLYKLIINHITHGYINVDSLIQISFETSVSFSSKLNQNENSDVKYTCICYHVYACLVDVILTVHKSPVIGPFTILIHVDARNNSRSILPPQNLSALIKSPIWRLYSLCFIFLKAWANLHVKGI